MVPTHPKHGPAEIEAIVHNIDVAAGWLGVMARANAAAPKADPLDAQKFDMTVD
ncbi:MAG: hypothetical protein R3F55_24525 [Alphaproteobacteria bacterium]